MQVNHSWPVTKHPKSYHISVRNRIQTSSTISNARLPALLGHAYQYEAALDSVSTTDERTTQQACLLGLATSSPCEDIGRGINPAAYSTWTRALVALSVVPAMASCTISVLQVPALAATPVQASLSSIWLVGGQHVKHSTCTNIVLAE